MQLITNKIIAPSSFPSLSSSKAKNHVYELGFKFCPSMDLVVTYPQLTNIQPQNAKTPGRANKDGLMDAGADGDDTEVAEDEQAAVGEVEEDEDDSVTVEVWRFNGQRAFNVTLDSDSTVSLNGRLEIQAVVWRDDGYILAILASDGVVRLVNCFSGKIVHQFSSHSTYAIPASPISPRTRRSVAREADAKISAARSKSSSLSYTMHFSDPTTTHSLLTGTANRRHQSEKFSVDAHSDHSSTSLDDLLGLNADVNLLLRAPADLPRELANIDVESFLPRLSCLPPVGFGGDDIFSTRASIDTVFHSQRKNLNSGAIDVLIAGHENGVLNVRIFDAFELGGVDLNTASGLRKGTRIGRVLRSFGWPFSNEVFVLAEDVRTRKAHLLGLDIKCIAQNSTALPVLATKATQLQNILRYLRQIQSQLAREIQTAFDLPTRFLRNLNEDLEKQDGIGSSFATAAYHAVVTGEVSGAFKEWLNDQLGDRGVKRWEKSVSDCLELVRRLVSEAWCPAVERAGVVLSRLHGLSNASTQNEQDGSCLGLDRKIIENLRQTLDTMAICGEECLREVGKEITSFASFIKWLKWEVEASGLEDTSEKLDEMREASDHGDVARVLGYIKQGPQQSTVKRYLISNDMKIETQKSKETNLSMRSKELRRRDGSHTQTIAIDKLLARMSKQCESLFEHIIQNLRRGMMARYINQLDAEADGTQIDARAIPASEHHKDSTVIDLHIIAISDQDDSANILHQTIQLDTHRSSHQTLTKVIKQPADSRAIIDVKIVDDEAYMVLVQVADGLKIYSRPIQNREDTDWELRHHFLNGFMDAGMSPARLEINGRKNRRVVGVVDANSRGYSVYDLDSGDSDQRPSNEEDAVMGG